jgi:uncharacterized membrane protein YphA (DoxX/SURF4 family)
MIGALALGGRTIVAAVLIVAGLAKARDREGTRAALRAFGCPRPFVGTAAWVMPGAELAIAAALVFSATAAAGLVAALTLLGIFTAVIGRALVRGLRPACRCFGERSDSPVGPASLARNAILIAVAGVALAAQLHGGTPNAVQWAAQQRGSDLLALVLAALLLAVVAGGAFVMVTLLSSYGRVLVRVENLERRVGLASARAFRNGSARNLERRRPSLRLRRATVSLR